MIIHTKFDIGQEVIVKGIDHLAIIMEIRYDTRIIYRLEYFWNGEPKYIDQFEEQLCQKK